MGSVIRFVAIAISAVVVLGFAMFAIDEIDKGSKTQQAKLERELGAPTTPTRSRPTPRRRRARERDHGAVREAIDDANDVLLAPFVDLVDSDSAWVNHGIPALLALLIYGFGLGLLANMLPKQRTHGSDWRTAARSALAARRTGTGRSGRRCRPSRRSAPRWGSARAGSRGSPGRSAPRRSRGSRSRG